MPTNYIKTNSGWNPISQIWIKVSTTWRSVSQGWMNVAGTWRQFFPGGLTPVIAAQVTIAKSGSGTVTLTGTNRRWTNFASGVYYFNSSTDDTNFSQIDTGSITNPSVGGTNTKTYVLTQSDVTANTTNYYQFAVAVTSSTPITATSTSTSVTVEGTRNITDLSSSAVAKTSVTLSWTASLYSGSQQVQYKQSSSGTWLVDSNQSGATSSYAVTSLSSGISYDFRIIPYTGSAATGYYGNPSNVYTVTTAATKKPNNPTGLTASSITTNSLTFSWTAPTTDASHDAATNYIWTYNTSGVEPSGGTSTVSTSASITSLSSNTTYYLWVIAENNDGFSSWVSTTATTLTAIITPGIPTSLVHTKTYTFVQLDNFLTRITSTQKNQQWTYQTDVNYNVSWTAPANAVSYEIAVNTTNSNPASAYASTANTSYTFSVTQINQNTLTYYFWVRAVSSDGTRGGWTSGSTGGTSTATVVSANWSLLLTRCGTSISSSFSRTGTLNAYLWTGVNASFTHFSSISGTIAGTAVSATSVGCV